MSKSINVCFADASSYADEVNIVTDSYSDKIHQAADSIKISDCLLIGVGSGMSASSGLNYADPTLAQKWYPEYFEQGKKSIIEIMSGFWPTTINKNNAAHFWGFWAKHIYHIRYEYDALPPYQNLFNIAKDKKHFISTTNVDCQLYKAGFDESSIFAPQGNYGFFQCVKPCSQEVYYNENMIHTMLKNMVSPFEIQATDIPCCPKCEKYLMPNLRCDHRFVEKPHIKNHTLYVNYINKAHDKNLVLLELGVGYNTPVIIRYPFEAITSKYPLATLIRVNLSDADVPENIVKKSVCIQEDIGKVLSDLYSLLK